jgi:1,4-dihydroxy-2-naphthoyl-CoA synthase
MTTGMQPARVTGSYILAIWGRMDGKRRFCVGQHVLISKEKIKFAKGGEMNYTTEIFQIIKVIRSIPRSLYELQDLNRKV